MALRKCRNDESFVAYKDAKGKAKVFVWKEKEKVYHMKI